MTKLINLSEQYNTRADVRVDSTCVPKEAELTRENPMRVIAASSEPRT